MNAQKTQPPAPVDKEALDISRAEVRNLLLRSEAFRALPPETQRSIARHTVEIASYLAAPEGIRADKLPNVQGKGAKSNDPYAVGLADSPASGGSQRSRGSNTNEEGKFNAQAAREGAAVAGALLREVNFPTFVSGLITGVFDAIVNSSIKQMEAYGEMVKSVAQTLNQFRDENVSPNQGRDHIVEQFPDMFEISVDSGGFGDDAPGPRVRLREGVDEDTALKRVNGSSLMEGQKPLSSLDDESVEGTLVPSARTQLATSRQQLLATMVLMGINRIVVTDGKISAKVMYDFQARDNMKFRKSATKFDYDPSAQKTTQTGSYASDYKEGDTNWSSERDKEGKRSTEYDRRGASYYAKGDYKNTSEPVMTLMSASSTDVDASLTTKASLAGIVEVNFKSDYLPLEKMADSFQIGMIQNAAQPRGGRGVGAGAAAPASSTPATSPAKT